jgi:hypothetical protein
VADDRPCERQRHRPASAGLRSCGFQRCLVSGLCRILRPDFERKTSVCRGAQIAARKPVMAKKLLPWSAGGNQPPPCEPSVWQREPLRVTFQPSDAAAVSYDLVGLSAVLVEDGDGNEESAAETKSN